MKLRRNTRDLAAAAASLGNIPLVIAGIQYRRSSPMLTLLEALPMRADSRRRQTAIRRSIIVGLIFTTSPSSHLSFLLLLETIRRRRYLGTSQHWHTFIKIPLQLSIGPLCIVSHHLFCFSTSRTRTVVYYSTLIRRVELLAQTRYYVYTRDALFSLLLISTFLSLVRLSASIGYFPRCLSWTYRLLIGTDGYR